MYVKEADNSVTMKTSNKGMASLSFLGKDDATAICNRLLETRPQACYHCDNWRI